jgi:membrane dipeptidase
MMGPMLAYTDHRLDPAAWAAELQISTEAVELYLASDVVDLHVDSFIWHRVFGYDLRRRHGPPVSGTPRGPLARSFWGHADFPRIREAAVSGAAWVITTNPVRTAAGRTRALRRNVDELCALFDSMSAELQLVRNAAEYREARRADRHAAFVAVQGANAFDGGLEVLAELPEGLLLLVTLVHLSSSRLGSTSSPLGVGSDRGLSDAGRELVRELERRRILVDLAHLNRRGFADAVEVHDPSLPLLVSHTGVSGVHPCWRNLDDDQLRAIADTGGTIGILYHSGFLGGSRNYGRASRIVDHLAHIVETVGDDHASLGSDWDGNITTPTDLATCLELPRLCELMRQRGWSPERIQKILGGNALRVIAAMRG